MLVDKNSMRFMSTRALMQNKIIEAKEMGFVESVFQGLANDGGLFYPVNSTSVQGLDSDFFLNLEKDLNFARLAAKMTYWLFPQEFSEEESLSLCREAFAFSPALKTISDDITLLELFHGPSCAFKDFGASYLAGVMAHKIEKENRRVCILTATSGDTGSAVAQAFYEKEGIDVVILYPSNRVSPLQEKQLTTLGGNIHALEVDGSFDDCQRIVKEAFTDKTMSHRFGLSSANSINIGRLIPQSFYYVYAWNQMRMHRKNDWVFTVPSGNFGNLSAGLLVRKWGLPIQNIYAACNANKVVPDYLSSGTFHPHASFSTLANAMDVGNPSNFERLECLFAEEWLRSLSKQGTEGSIESLEWGELKAEKIHECMSRVIKGVSISDEEIREEIRRIYDVSKEFICPHTAVGTAGFRKIRSLRDDSNASYAHSVVLSTAHAGKFFETINESCNVEMKLPKRLEVFLHKKSSAIKISPVLDALGNALERVLK